MEQEKKNQSFREWLSAAWEPHPRRIVIGAIAVATAAGLLVALLVQFGPSWQRYNLKNIGLSLELPAEPTAEPAGVEGKAGVTYRANTPGLAVLASGGTIPEGTAVQPAFLVEQAMNFVRAGEGIDKLEYQVTQKSIRGQGCLHVSATFLLGDAPARLSGVFFVGKKRHAHVIFFYSTDKGAEAIRRALASIHFTDG